jgi:thiol:disulfide interchange protein
MARTENQRALPLALFVAAVVLVILRVVLTLTAEPHQPVEEPGRPEVTAVTNLPNVTNPDLIQWVPLEAAGRSAKPVLYDFTAAWCGPCRQLEADVFRNPELAAQINARFTPVRVVDRKREDGANLPDVEALQERFEVRAFPTVVIAGASGAATAKMEGSRGPEAFAQLLDSVR